MNEIVVLMEQYEKLVQYCHDVGELASQASEAMEKTLDKLEVRNGNPDNISTAG